MQSWIISSFSTPRKQGTAKNQSLLPSLLNSSHCVPSSTAPGYPPLCCWTDPVPLQSPQKSKPWQECLVCPCFFCQVIGRRNAIGQKKSCLLLNLELPPSRKRDWSKGNQYNSLYCHVFHQLLKGIMTPTLLTEKTMNHCIRLSLITALKLYDSKY